MIKTADHILDLGPDGGDAGGRIVAAGTPEESPPRPRATPAYSPASSFLGSKAPNAAPDYRSYAARFATRVRHMELPTTQNRADSPLFLGRTPVLYALAAHAGGRRWHRQNVIRVCYEDIFVLCSLAMKGRQLIRRLKAAGVEIIEGRGKGGHVIARYRGRQTTVPVHGSRDIGPDFIRKLCRQLGLDPTEIL